MTDVTPFVTPPVDPAAIPPLAAPPVAQPPSVVGAASPADMLAGANAVIQRVLTPSLQTLEGKIAVVLIAIIQASLGVFVALTTTGVFHPSGTLSAEIIGGGQAIAAYIAGNFVSNRTALKAAAAASQASTTP